MFHLDNTSGVPEMPEPKEQQSITPKWFGESVEQGGISWPGADWFNIIQAELLNALKAAGITPEKSKYNQLANAIPVLGESIIRNDLNSNDGFRLIGRCPDLSTLRLIEPLLNGQAILLERAVPGGPVINAILTHDPHDMTTEDDGCSVFVTKQGARWKYDISSGYNALLAGFSPALNNMAQCINTCVGIVNRKVIESGTILGVQATINVPALSGGVYLFTESVRIPPFASLVFAGTQMWDFSTVFSDAIVITGNFDGFTVDMQKNGVPDKTLNSGAKCLSGAGILFVKGPGYTFSSGAGLYVGNRDETGMHCRDTVVDSIKVCGFKNGFNSGCYNTYINTVRDCDFYRNRHGLAFDNDDTQPDSVPAYKNSGERVTFSNCTIADNYEDNLYVAVGAPYIYLDSCSLDYPGVDQIKFGPYAMGTVNITNSHVEGIPNMLVNQPLKSITYGVCKVVFDNTRLTLKGNGYSGVRQIFNGSNALVINISDSCHIDSGGITYYANDAYGTFGPPPGVADTGPLINMHYTDDANEVWLPSYSSKNGYCLNLVTKFSGDENAIFNTSMSDADASIDHRWVELTGGMSAVYGGANDADADGFIPLKITSQSTSDALMIFWKFPIKPTRYNERVFSQISLKVADSIGSVYCQGVTRCMSRQSLSVRYNPGTTNVSGVAINENMMSTVNGDRIVNVKNALNRPYSTLTKDDFTNSLPLSSGSDWRNCEYYYPGIKIWGFTGTVYIKLPVFWIPSRVSTIKGSLQS